MTLASWIMRHLEALRVRAVPRLEEGESPGVVACVFGTAAQRFSVWITSAAPGCAEVEAAFRKAAEGGQQEAAVGLQYGDLQKLVWLA
jgi:hypothetical protein